MLTFIANFKSIMENISIEATTKTPAILSDSELGTIEIKGRSNPENSSQFYKPLMDWVEGYTMNPKEKTIVNIQLEHFNTSSSKCILDFFKKMEVIHKSNKGVEINWHYEVDDEDIMEAGEVYRTMTEVPIKLIEY